MGALSEAGWGVRRGRDGDDSLWVESRAPEIAKFLSPTAFLFRLGQPGKATDGPGLPRTVVFPGHGIFSAKAGTVPGNQDKSVSSLPAAVFYV